MARTSGDESALVSQMRQALLGLEPDLLLMESQTMKAQMQGMLFPVRVAATLVTAFSALGLALAAVGLYGIIAFAVTQRTKEIGIRMAVGARPGTVVRLVLRQGLKLAVAGLGAGALLGAAATSVLAGMLYGVSSADPVAWAGAAARAVHRRRTGQRRPRLPGGQDRSGEGAAKRVRARAEFVSARQRIQHEGTKSARRPKKTSMCSAKAAKYHEDSRRLGSWRVRVGTFTLTPRLAVPACLSIFVSSSILRAFVLNPLPRSPPRSLGAKEEEYRAISCNRGKGTRRTVRLS